VQLVRAVVTSGDPQRPFDATQITEDLAAERQALHAHVLTATTNQEGNRP
jgi:hypothetical protein